jgi:hypothetical protein
MNRRLRNAITLGVAAVWIVAMSAGIFVDGYDPPAAINGAMMIVLGWLGYDYKRDLDKRNGKSNGNGGDHV